MPPSDDVHTMTAPTSDAAAVSVAGPDRTPSSAGAHWILIAICAAFLAARLPVAWRQIPAQDEDYFAVPGLTILEEGVPRIPYMPSRNPEGTFYRADELLFTLPPLYFYWEAVVYWFAGPSTGAARLASLLCAVAAITLVYLLGRAWFQDAAAAVWSAGLYAVSRVVYFPAMIARPDMLCGALGLGVLWSLWNWERSRNRAWLAAAGAALGAAALAHPFAIVVAIQAAGWVGIVSRGWPARLRNAGLLTAVAMLVFLLWLPLIMQHPEAFRAQFLNSVVGKSGPGLVSRLLLPFESLRVQTPIFVEHVGPLQAFLMLGGIVAATALCAGRPDRGLQTAVALAWSGIYLHVACVGVHPTKGYWCYTGALAFLCAGGVAATLLARLRAVCRAPRILPVAAGLAVVLVMLPGSGLRTLAAHLEHWNDVNYDAPRFTRQLIEAVPPEAKLVVDPGYIFDFHRAGRNTTLALEFPYFFSVRGTEYDLLVAGPYSLRDGVPEVLNARFVRAYGDHDDLFACYAEIYESAAAR